MIFQLMRRNVAQMAVIASCFAAVSLVISAQVGPVIAMPLLIVVWIASRRHPTPFECSLPILGRSIVLARALTVLLLTLAPMCVWMVFVRVLHPEYASTALVLEYSGVVALAVLLPYAVRPGELVEPPAWMTVTALMTFVGIAVLIFAELPAATGASLFAVAVAAALARIWRTVPDSLQIAPITPEASGMPRLVEPAVRGRFAAAQPLLVSMFSPIALLLYAVMTVEGSTGRWLFYFSLVTLMLTQSLRPRLNWMNALPFSNRARLAVLLVPTMLIPLLFVALGSEIPIRSDRTHNPIGVNAPSASNDAKYANNRTRVSLEYWSRTPEAGVPVITSPWGETVSADTLSILGAMLYNPYSTTAHSSHRFVEWQFERAATAVYGTPMSMEQYDSGAPLPPTFVDGTRMRILNLGATLALGLLLVLLTELARSHRLHATRIRGSLAEILALTPLWVVWSVGFYYVFRRHVFIGSPITEAALRQLSAMLPQNTGVVALVAAVPVISLYAALEWQFGQSETWRRAKRPVWSTGDPG